MHGPLQAALWPARMRHARPDIALHAWALHWAGRQLAGLHACTPTFPALIVNCMSTVARNWDQLAATAQPSFSPLHIWLFVLVAMIAHDAWFFLAHTAMHRFKWVYRHVHAKHHTLGSNCSPLGERATFLGRPFLWHLGTCCALNRPGWACAELFAAPVQAQHSQTPLM